MKRLSFLFSVAAIAAVSMLSSCKKDSTTDPVPGPSITAAWVGASGSTIMPDAATESFTYTVTTGESLSEVNIVSTYSTGTQNKSVTQTNFPKTKGFKSNTTDTETVIYTIPTDAAGNITITISAKDSKGAAVSTMLYVSYIAERKDQLLYNLLGSQPGAYNLMEGTTVASTGPASSKDLLDITAAADGIYKKGWTSGNNTKFVKANGFNYATADMVTMGTAWIAGMSSAQTTVTNVAVGDVFIAELRGIEGEFVAIKVTAVVDDNKVGTGNNQDYIKFDYKYFGMDNK